MTIYTINSIFLEEFENQSVNVVSYANSTNSVMIALHAIQSNVNPIQNYPLTSAQNIEGSSFNDRIEGNANANILLGNAGNDFLYGWNGQDIIYGGTGADNIYGGLDNDRLYGNEGDDVLAGDDGNDIFFGGAGIDKIFGGNGIDTVDYSLDSAGVKVSLHAFGATDGEGFYDALNSIENIAGSDFNDRLEGDGSVNVINGNAGNDFIYGWAGADQLYGDAGIDHIFGGDDNDIIYGGDGNDVLAGEAGNDTLYGDAGADQLWGGYGNDTLYGGDGNDTLYGDLLVEDRRNDGNDTLYGGAGNDVLIGRDGDDVFHGGAGIDQFWGGTGSDTFVLELYNGTDVIMDAFISTKRNGDAKADHIDVSDILSGHYDPLTDAITDFVRITTLGTNSIISVDQNGGGDNFIHVADIRGVTGIENVALLESNGTLITV